MRNFNYIQSIYKSFYSKALYRDVAMNWGGGVVLYLFFLLVLCWSVSMIKIQPIITVAAHQFSEQIVTQVPFLKIKDGIVSTPANHPYFIKDPETQKTILIIDTSGRYKTIEQAQAPMLLTKDTYISVDKNNVSKTYQLSNKLTMNIDPLIVKNYIIRWSPWLWVVLLPFFILMSFLFRLIQGLVYACIGKIFALLAGVRISYAKVLKLSFVSVTPAIILETIVDLANIDFQREFLIYFILAMGYLLFAILANKKES